MKTPLPPAFLILVLLALPALGSAPAGADDFASAPAIVGTHVLTADIVIDSFTVEANEKGGIAGHPPAKSAWWKYTPVTTGVCVVSTVPGFPTGPALSDTTLSVFTGSSVAALTLVESNDDYFVDYRYSRVVFLAQAGVTYYLDVNPYDPAATGSIALLLRQWEPEAGSWKGLWNFGAGLGDTVGTLEYTTTAGGSLSGRIRIDAVTRPFAGRPSVDGFFHVTVPGVSTAVPSISFTIDLAHTDPGSGTFVVDNGSIATLGTTKRAMAYPRGTPAAVEAGYYTATVVQGSAGMGFLTATVKPTGQFKATGYGADGTALSLAGVLSGDPAAAVKSVPVYQYNKSGSFLFAEITLDATQAKLEMASATGESGRRANPNPAAKFYPAGFTADTTISGARYTKPAAGSRAGALLEAVNGAGQFKVGAVAGEIAGFTEPVTLTTLNKLTFASAARRPALKVNPATGVITGAFYEPATQRRAIAGVIVANPTPYAAGLVTGLTSDSAFTITK